MSLMTATPEITPKQVTFLRNLAKEKDWSKLDVAKVRLIKTVVRAETNEDGTLKVFVPRKDVSSVINSLLGCKKIEVAPTATPTYPAAATAPAGQELTWAQIKANALALLDTVPAAYKGIKYAIPNTDPKSHNTWVFYEVKEYKGKRYLNRLQGAPGDWNRQFVAYKDYAGIIQRIKDMGPKASAFKFSEIYTVCACCGAPLSNGKSIAEGFGPVCIKKF